MGISMNNKNTNYTQSITIHCSIAVKTETGFDVLTDNDCMSLSEFGFSSEVLLNCDAPYANRNWVFIYGDNDTIKDLFADAYKRFGVDNCVKSMDNENALNGPDLIIEVDNNTYLSFDDYNIPFKYIVDSFKLQSIRAHLLPVFGLGDVLVGKGYLFRFYIPSHEGNKHNVPHVHVDGKDGRSGTFSIDTGEPLEKNSLREHEITKVGKIIRDEKDELMKCWNILCDGLTIEKDYE